MTGAERWSTPGVTFAVWFVLALTAVFVVWGENPRVFPTPDEALVRSAARAISQRGSPVLQLPFPDPEDLAHARSWVTLGDQIVPTYAPVLLYVYGNLLRLGVFGRLLIAALSASGVAAFAAASARLLPEGRRALGGLAPALAFPALYWLLRPWMNVSALLSCLCWALFFWTSFRADGRLCALAGVSLFVGAAAAIRPDYAAFLMLTALLACVAVRPERLVVTVAGFVIAGAAALGINLILNHALTGHALRPAYQVALERRWGDIVAPPTSKLGVLRVLLIPMGWPKFEIARYEFYKYWWSMGPIAVLLVGQLATFALVRRGPRLPRVLYALVFVCFALFVYSRLHDDVFGGQVRAASVEHSVPRYLTPAYLFCALPPLVLVARAKKKALFVAGSALMAAVAGSGLYEIAVREPWSLTAIRRYLPETEALLTRLKNVIPAQAIVYSVTSDKFLWSHFRLGTVDKAEPTAASMARARASGFAVYLLDPKYRPFSSRLAQRLDSRGLALWPVESRIGLYRLRPSNGARARRTPEIEFEPPPENPE